MHRPPLAILLAALLLAPFAALAHSNKVGSNVNFAGNDLCNYDLRTPEKIQNQGNGDQAPTDFYGGVDVEAPSPNSDCDFWVGLINKASTPPNGIVPGSYYHYFGEYLLEEPFETIPEFGGQVTCAKDGPDGQTSFPHKEYATVVYLPDGAVSGGPYFVGEAWRGHWECGE